MNYTEAMAAIESGDSVYRTEWHCRPENQYYRIKKGTSIGDGSIILYSSLEDYLPNWRPSVSADPGVCDIDATDWEVYV